MLEWIAFTAEAPTFDWWTTFGHVADVVTIVAALIAFFGVATTFLTRPRVSVTANAYNSNSAQVFVTHSRGSSPARNLYMAWGGLDENRTARYGDGANPWVPTLIPGDSRFISVYDPDQVFYSSDPNEHEMRLPIGKPFGFIMDVSWQRPTVPWLRVRRVIIRTQVDRAAGKSPTVLRGRAASKTYAVAMRPPQE